ncbi:bifunctional aspartate kinase/homoserine dehydrogenase I [Labilibaculum manganireducens]|uniref:Bifunctional aspartate kinase/homoserine dehydrogenase I n=1 Tax=Labilibaculum manganireducens TaxID=1940525 RepID=A0A2N3HVU4_9BACT|nr:bifunctional aspartate kinase/homoserine dehydrogenase I [Labilibaculum manganireducens]PKQ62190.1 bifunctional aspartate kinase/homoserine dehydrogenase I [Labilibaculum manganireducens]
MKVLKFGGSSVSNSENCKRVQEIIKRNYANCKQVVVVSAFGGVTDELERCINLASNRNKEYENSLFKVKERHFQVINELNLPAEIELGTSKKFDEIAELLQGVYLLEEISQKVKNSVMGSGEILSSLIFSAYLNQCGMNTVLFDSRDFIRTQNGKGVFLNSEQTNKNLEAVKDVEFQVALFPGFIASGQKGEMTLLGRGGSDYTASILAAGLKCSELEIWTDVSGMFTADPRLVSQALPIEQMSFQEAMELSHFGAKVIYPPTLIPVLQNKINVRIKNTFAPDEKGTLITSAPKSERSIVRGLSSINNINLFTLSGSGMVGISGFASRFFTCLAQNKINVVLITQASSEQSMSVGINEGDRALAIEAVRSEFEMEIRMNLVNEPAVEQDLSIVAVVGEDMGYTPGISGKVFSVLGRNGVNIRAMAQGGNELNITFMVPTFDVKKVLNVIHEDFFISTHKKVNLYIAGVGNVGGKLLEFIKNQYDYLLEEKGLQLIVRAVTNSRKMCFAKDENMLQNWKQKLEEESEVANLQEFVKRMDQANLRNSVFVDITASEAVSKVYQQVLNSTVSIVACNKIAASSEFDNYLRIKAAAKKHNVEFMFESNVGAGLPVISTINSLIHTGDKIVGIDAVVSGSLNFIMNEFNNGKSFVEAVKMAMEQGFTEPDPKIDLSGMDVLRKLLILSREAGYKLEVKDVEHEPMIPLSCLNGETAADLIRALEAHNDHFEAWRTVMAEKNIRYRYIASFANGKANVSLKEVTPDHPFYDIHGKDNVISLKTKWYSDQPLIIKGAGAGAEVTASGIFGDIIRITSN